MEVILLRYGGYAIALPILLAIIMSVRSQTKKLDRASKSGVTWAERNQQIFTITNVYQKTNTFLVLLFFPLILFTNNSGARFFSIALLAILVASYLVSLKDQFSYFGVQLEISAFKNNFYLLQSSLQIFLFVIVFSLVPMSLDIRQIVLFIAAYSVALILYLFGWEIARLFGVIKPAPESIKKLANQRGYRKEEVYEVVSKRLAPLSSSNGNIGLTSGLLANMTEPELLDVITHEVSHKNRNRQNVHWYLLVFHVMLLSHLLLSQLLGPFTSLILVFFLGILTTKYKLKAVRRSIYNADAYAITHSDPNEYFETMKKLHRLSATPVETNKKASHPGLYDRMIACELKPNFERPNLKGRVGGLRRLYLIPVFSLACVFLGSFLAYQTLGEKSSILYDTVARIDRGIGPGRLAGLHISENNVDQAGHLLEAAEDLGYDSNLQKAVAAYTLSEKNLCAEGSTLYDEAYKHWEALETGEDEQGNQKEIKKIQPFLVRYSDSCL